jgi:VanZ family protein
MIFICQSYPEQGEKARENRWNMKGLKTIFLKLPAPLIAVAIWILSSQSSIPQPKGIFGIDKIEHFIAYAVLASAVGLWVSAPRWERRPWAYFFLIAGIAAAYGLIDEIHQSFVPGRDCNVWDWIADAAGALAGAALARLAVARLLIKRAQNR